MLVTRSGVIPANGDSDLKHASISATCSIGLTNLTNLMSVTGLIAFPFAINFTALLEFCDLKRVSNDHMRGTILTEVTGQGQPFIPR